VHAVQDIEEVAVGVDARPLDARISSLMTFWRGVAPGLSRSPRR
jgi:hypothetical protein